MTRTITVRIPVLVTADGKWAANGSHEMAFDDWQWLDEMCDGENPTINPTRMFVTVTLPLPPHVTEVKAASVEAAP